MTPEQPKDNNYFEDGLGENVYETERSLNQKPKEDKQDWKELPGIQALQKEVTSLQNVRNALNVNIQTCHELLSEAATREEALQKENERLMGLSKKAFFEGGSYTMNPDKYWQQFKQQNNL